MEYNELKKWFRRFRLERNLTQNEMAQECGLNGQYLSAIENGRKQLTEKTILKLQSTYKLKDKDIKLLSQYKKQPKNQLAALRYRLEKVQKERDGLERAYLLALARIATLEEGKGAKIATLYEYFLGKSGGKKCLKK